MNEPELKANTAALREVQPVHDLGADEPSEGMGLCLSGGGYRAMLFHLGSLWRLNDAKLLRYVRRISSVSGGSITAATLGLHWNELDWNDDVAVNFEQAVVTPVRQLAGKTLDISSVAEGLLPFTSAGERIAAAYDEHLFRQATLQDLPDEDGEGPRFVICATNLESAVLFRFAKPYSADYRVGSIPEPQIPLAQAVAASSAFPPFLSPLEIDLSQANWETVTGNDLVENEWRSKLKLSDGGVYDNLGLEPVWKRYLTILISDGGGQVAEDPNPPSNWPQQTLRVLWVIDSQVRALRKRQAIASFKLGLRTGTFWSVQSDVPDYDLDDPLDFPPELARELAQTPTRLSALKPDRQQLLINWGYVIADTALRRWVDPELRAAAPPAVLTTATVVASAL